MREPNGRFLPREGRGYHINADGYIRIHRGKYKRWYLHRAKADEAMKASGRELTADMRVDHLCGNRKCPCLDFHLLILPKAMTDVLDGGKRPAKGFKNHVGTCEGKIEDIRLPGV